MKKIFQIIIIFASINTTIAQTGNVGIGTANPDGSAALDISSTTRGFLFPRMSTTDRDAISSPALGLTIFNTTTNCIETNMASGIKVWGTVSCPCSNITTTTSINGPAIVGANQTNVTYSIASPITGYSYSWSVSGGNASISGSTTGTSVTISWSSNTVGTAAAATTITVTPTAGVCTGTAATKTVNAGGKQVFTWTGSDQTWGGTTYGVTSAVVKLWGAGGGASTNSTYTCPGGSGAFITGTAAITAGTQYVVVVGTGGCFCYVAAGYIYGGGGSVTTNGNSSQGGGYSGIFNTSVSQANAIAVAGGGGGGGYNAGLYLDGGGGGNTSGSSAPNYSATYTGGGGGTTSVAGAGGLYNNVTQGAAGIALRGGVATNSTYSGGCGGGGYYGGGSGYGSASTTYYSSGGGGGSSYLGSLTSTGSSVAGNTSTNGTRAAAPATGNVDYSGTAGRGAIYTDSGGQAGDGRVVILW